MIAGNPEATEPILSVRDLSVGFRTDEGEVTAVDRVSFDLRPKEFLGIVGESGCGKTVTSKAIMRLLPERTSFFQPGSQILFEGRNLATASESEMRKVRGDRIAMVFQEPMTALNPVFTVGWQIDEALKHHTSLSRRQRRERALEMLRLVEIPQPRQRIDEYPHQLSGGMRQRVMIAMALCCEPDILIADEPTTALDVTIQAQILRLMQRLREQLGTAIVLITHNLGVVAQVCERVIVMYAGQIVEMAAVNDLFHRPQHPYTLALLRSLPGTGKNMVRGGRLPTIAGTVPSLRELPVGCRFADRCASRQPQCSSEAPALAPGRNNWPVRCFFPCQPDGDPPADRKEQA